LSDWLLALVPQYGLWLLAGATFVSCLALPIPASLLMSAAGGFVAAGDLAATGTALAALAGAVAGDQAGYAAGRFGGRGFQGRLAARSEPLRRAADFLGRRGGLAVFLSRSLVSALGPYVNLAAGAATLSWPRFTFWGVLGEAVWVCLYTGSGYAFAGNLEAAAGMTTNVLGLLAAATVAAGLACWLKAALRSDRKG
jgi:membrane protein DedA with SNARE-associated domain